MPAKLKTAEDIEILRQSGLILAEVLDTLAREAVIGTKLSYLDRHARELMASRGATPTFLGYRPEGALSAYSAAICTSVNDIIVHGLPGDYRLRAGDVLKIDAGVTFHGLITDAAVTVAVPPVVPTVSRLLETTHRALDEALAACGPGKKLGDIGAAIERAAKRGGCTVIAGLTGHGVGFALHEDPTVYNYGTKGEGMKLVPGLVLAIEPMFSLGSPDIHQYPDDSYGTADKSIAAHFEHTVAITEDGYEVLTVLPKR